MAKYYGEAVLTGRIGARVYRINRGVTTATQYQPNVFNPRSNLQVAQRAKLKLASQLAAEFAPEISAFKTTGLISKRNNFIKDLFDRQSLNYANGSATVNMVNVRLTESSVAMGTMGALTRADGKVSGQITVNEEYVARGAQVRVVLVQQRTHGGSVAEWSIINAVTIAEPTSENNFGFELNVMQGEAYFYAYVFVPNESAITKYGDIFATLNGIAKLDVIRTESPSSLDYSETMVGTNRN